MAGFLCPSRRLAQNKSALEEAQPCRFHRQRNACEFSSLTCTKDETGEDSPLDS
jgi:hypothetical protein